jgi:hypothetical protein
MYQRMLELGGVAVAGALMYLLGARGYLFWVGTFIAFWPATWVVLVIVSVLRPPSLEVAGRRSIFNDHPPHV